MKTAPETVKITSSHTDKVFCSMLTWILSCTEIKVVKRWLLYVVVVEVITVVVLVVIVVVVVVVVKVVITVVVIVLVIFIVVVAK